VTTGRDEAIVGGEAMAKKLVLVSPVEDVKWTVYSLPVIKWAPASLGRLAALTSPEGRE